jgi:uncharacterized protein (TIGR00375 family)
MKIISDLHIHSKYSRACSSLLTLENIEKTCEIKGINLVGTGDFSFPAWFKEIKDKLLEIDNTGLFKLKTSNNDKVKFILSNELSLVYKKNGKTRRIHLVIHAPDLKSVSKLNDFLDKNYNIRSDGRPILGLSAERLMERLFSIDERFIVYPAHIWTPWYAVFGSMSGFTTLEECFDIWTPYIYALETGLSSDPEMNWRLRSLDDITLLSSSDAHSLPNLGREATVFDLKKPSYEEIYLVIKNKWNTNTLSLADQKKKPFLSHTIEFYPEEGMYHLDGHRSCSVCLEPQETENLRRLCPRCGRPLVVGVLNQINALADRATGEKPKNAANFVKLVELDKIIAESLNLKSRSAKKVLAIYENLIKALGPELNILENSPIKEIEKHSNPKIALGIDRVRCGKLKINPGYDGVYGEIKIF